MVQVGPADQAEGQKRIGIRAFGQRFLRELPQLDAGLQRNLDDRPHHRLRAADDFPWSKQPHAVDEADQALFVAAQRDLVMRIGVQQQLRRVHHEVGVDRLPFGDFVGDALDAIVAALGIDRGKQRSSAADKRPQER